MGRMSIATIDKPEFINLRPLDINPGLSACEIKVLYVGKNRNKSVISKEVATEMSKTLRGAPIVGYFREDKNDFGDHGDRVIIDQDGIKFECLTQPYGFVSPDAQVWFQKFNDTDEFGNSVVREYLMTTGYLWTKQFKEAVEALKTKGQSMELDSEKLDGYWTTDLNSNIDFFIINDAVFSKLCILGDDIEPCFEGANITEPDISKHFSIIDNNNFTNTLFNMMQELRFALQGGQAMDLNTAQDPIVQSSLNENSSTEDKFEKTVNNENDNTVEEQFKKSDKNENETKDQEESKEESNSKEDSKEQDDDEEAKKKYSLLESKYNELSSKYSVLEAEYQNLVSFKNSIESAQKDELIKSFYMLSDEDKQDVITNKDKYSLDEIESKLSVICFRKKVDFGTGNKEEDSNKENPVVTFSLSDDTKTSSVPGYITALRKTQSEQK